MVNRSVTSSKLTPCHDYRNSENESSSCAKQYLLSRLIHDYRALIGSSQPWLHSKKTLCISIAPLDNVQHTERVDAKAIGVRSQLNCLVFDSSLTNFSGIEMERCFWEAPLLGRGLDAQTMLGIKTQRDSDSNPGSCRPPAATNTVHALPDAQEQSRAGELGSKAGVRVKLIAMLRPEVEQE